MVGKQVLEHTRLLGISFPLLKMAFPLGKLLLIPQNPDQMSPSQKPSLSITPVVVNHSLLCVHTSDTAFALNCICLFADWLPY